MANKTTRRLKSGYPQMTVSKSSRIYTLPNVPYTSQATISDFALNAVEGEFGVYNAKTQALQTGAASEGDCFVFLQKRDGDTKTSTTYYYKPNEVSQAPYTENILKKDVVTVNTGATDKNQLFELFVRDVTWDTADEQPFVFRFTSITGAETPEEIVDGIMENYQWHLDNSETGMGGRDFTIKLTKVGANQIEIESIYEETNFYTVLRDELLVVGTVEMNGEGTSVAWKMGSGLGWQVQWLEEQGDMVWQGATGWDMDPQVNFENVTLFAKEACTYDFFTIDVKMRIFETAAAVAFDHNNHPLYFMFLIQTDAPGTTGSALLSQLNTIFPG